MASGAEIVGAAGAGASIIPGLIGRGQNQRNAQDISHSAMYDPNANQFGPNGAADYNQARMYQAEGADRRNAFQANYAQADFDRQRAAQARAGQSTMLNQMMARAQGRVPSIAEMQANRQMQQVGAQQASIAASARGAGGLALAQQNRANNTANAQGAISGQAQVNAAQERLAAEQAAFGGASNMRGQDYAGQQQAANQAQFQTGMQQMNRNANDQRSLSLQQMGHQGLLAEQQGAVQMQGVAAQSHAAAEQANQRTADSNAQNKGLIDTIGDFFSDMRAKLQIPSDFTSKLPTSYGGLGDSPAGVSVPPLGMGGGLSGKLPGGAPSFASGGQMSAEGGVNALNPMSGPGEASFDVGSASGGMDVQASDERHKAFGTRFGSNPLAGSGTETQYIMSDKAAKDRVAAQAFEAGEKAALMRAMGGVSAHGETSTGSGEPMADPNNDGSPDDMTPEQYRAFRTSLRKAAEAGPPQPKPPAPAPTPAPREGVTVRNGDAEMVRRRAAYAGANQDGMGMASQLTPAGGLASLATRMMSDFRSKQQLQLGKGGSEWELADPSRGQMRYVPGRGWIAPDDEARQRMFEASQDGPDFGDVAGQDARIAEMERADQQRAQNNHEAFEETQRRLAPERSELSKDLEQQRKDAPSREEIVKADEDARQSAPRTPGQQPQDAGPIWLRALSRGADRFNDAQFGDRPVRSDRRAKNVYEPERRPIMETASDSRKPRDDRPDFDQRRAPDSREASMDRTFRRDTPADQARVKRAFEDRAGREADDMMAGYAKSLEGPSAVASRLAPSDSPVAAANRTMKGQPYIYKKEFTPPDQKPGEPNFGFMAQNLEQHPITATAVKPDSTGMKRVDALKLLRILGASVADLQEQEDETRVATNRALTLAKGGRRKAA